MSVRETFKIVYDFIYDWHRKRAIRAVCKQQYNIIFGNTNCINNAPLDTGRAFVKLYLSVISYRTYVITNGRNILKGPVNNNTTFRP